MNERSLWDFAIALSKCFLILLFFGFLLPSIIDHTLYIMLEKNRTYGNGVFVYKVLDKNRNLLYNYVFLFKNFIANM